MAIIFQLAAMLEFKIAIFYNECVGMAYKMTCVWDPANHEGYIVVVIEN